MKLRLSTIILLLALVAGGIGFWLSQQTTAEPEPVKAAVAKPAPVKAAPPSSGIMPPVLKPVAPTASSPEAVATAKPEPAKRADQQASLDTAIPNLVDLLQTGDLVTAFENYTPPDVMAQIPAEQVTAIEDQLHGLVQQPAAMGRLAIMSQVLASLGGQTPTYNDAGDVATYPIPNLGGGARQASLHFQKIDGRWYIPQNDLNMLGNALGM